ncbi:MAG TPA: aldehyde dehydrogenase [Smithellaceae bacterium]|nr:aldehyde dehydrogenase [Smithellaceae bacterium]
MENQMLRELYERQKTFFRSGKTRDIDFRIAALKKLNGLINTFEKEILDAIYLDLRKEETDAYATEISGIYQELKVAIKNVRDWAARQKVPTPFFLKPSKSYIYKEPYGVALIIAPWNYPFQLTIMPLIGALAAGNTAILKPSEIAPHTAAILEKMINGAFSAEYLHVVTGGVEETQALLDLPPDYIFFTGSVPVGKVVMSAAAKHLTPLTLELGGKSPAIVHSSADLKTAVERICWGKFLNAGQTCIAPDYILVHNSVKDHFLDELIKAILKFYGEDASKHPRYCRIINDRHFQRLTALIDSAKTIYGGRTDASDRYIEPTLLYPASWDDPIMQDEIFGPILPILPYSDLDDVIGKINDRPKPLALYMFVNDKVIRRKMIRDISFGGGAVNNTIMHIVSHEMPFGGVGQSGLGRYHGKYSFEAFSHTKSILRSYNSTDPVEIAYPHKGGFLFKLKLKMMKYLP